MIELVGYYSWLPEDSATKAAQAGDTAGRRWTERDWMIAAQLSYLQTVLQVLWIGLRLKGKPPEAAPVKTPLYERPPDPAQQQKQAEHLARVAALRRFSPTHQPSRQAEPPVP